MAAATTSATQSSVESDSKANDTSETSLGYSLFSNPPYLADMRQRLFDPVTPLHLSFADFNTYYPFVDNVYTTLRSAPSVHGDRSKIDYYPCRIRQSQQPDKSDVHSPHPDPNRHTRAKRQRIEETCPMILKVTTTLGGADPQCIVERADANIGHIHDLDRSDAIKRNSAIMNAARIEGEKGYTPMSIHDQMCKEPDKMNEAGGKHMKVSDVRNVLMKWRNDHPDQILKTHDGAESKPRKRQSRSSAVNGQHTYQNLPPDTLRYPTHAQTFLQEYLPPRSHHPSGLPSITLSYATSLDARLSSMPGVQTVLSSPESKAMTHYLRSKHDGILIGVGTAMADDPSLNCRIEGVGGYGPTGLNGQPRPIIIDPHGRLTVRPDMKVLQVARSGRGRGPWIIVAEGTRLSENSKRVLKEAGGDYIQIRWQAIPTNAGPGRLFISWYDIFSVLAKEGLKSIMVEGGGVVLSELLQPQYRPIISSVIVTVVPTFLGTGGTLIAPNTFEPTGQDHTGRTTFAPIPNRLRDIKWQPMGTEDVIMCGKLGPELLPPHPNGTNNNSNNNGEVAPPVVGMIDGIDDLAHPPGGGPSQSIAGAGAGAGGVPLRMSGGGNGVA